MGDDKFHKAARDGYLDLLRDGNKRDLNKPDEDGMTPTMWAAFHGNLDALRLICYRGGDPDKCSLIGNTALHWAAHNGHLSCVSFLIHFGVNMWALDNQFHTALDLAGMEEHMDVVGYLDDCVAKQSALNKKTVARLKEKSFHEAEKRVKQVEKLQRKTEIKMEKEKQKEQEWERRHSEDPAPGKAEKGTLRNFFPGFNKNKRNSTVSGVPTRFSDYTHTTTTKKAKGGTQKKLYGRKVFGTMNNDFKVGQNDGGKRTMSSLRGFHHDSEILFAGNGISSRSPLNGVMFDRKMSGLGRATSEPEIYHTIGQDSGFGDDGTPYDTKNVYSSSIFERPGWGKVAFRHDPMANAFHSLQATDDDIDYGKITDSSTTADASIGSLGSLAQRNRHDEAVPWGDEVLQEEDEMSGNAHLEAFLVSTGLQDIMPLLAQEKIDLDALMIISDSDLKEIGVPMGPRKKLLDAILKRKLQFEDPGMIEDTVL